MSSKKIVTDSSLPHYGTVSSVTAQEPSTEDTDEGTSFVTLLLLGLSVASIVIGAVFFKQCPVQSKIPIYLIVMGAFGIVGSLIGLFDLRKRRAGDSESDNQPSFCGVFTTIVLIAALIAGSIWIFSHYQPDYDHSLSSNYCHPILYKFSFGLTIFSYVFIFIGVCLNAHNA